MLGWQLYLGALFAKVFGPSFTAIRASTMLVALATIFALYSVAGTHDAFGHYRARLNAINELRAAGVPDTSIDAGFEHNGMTQIEAMGYVNDPRIRVLASFHMTLAATFPSNCQPQLTWLTPAIVPGDALSYEPAACGGLSRFAPVSFHDWIGNRSVNLYIVNTIKSASDQH